jgi:hypothetical protein
MSSPNAFIGDMVLKEKTDSLKTNASPPLPLPFKGREKGRGWVYVRE